MKTLFATLTLFVAAITVHAVDLQSLPHRVIYDNPAFTRDATDRRYNVWTDAPAKVKDLIKAYGIRQEKVFILPKGAIFAVFLNDRISEDLVQITHNKTANQIVADYADSGAMYKLKPPGDGLKYSHITAVVFTPTKPGYLGHLGLRGMVANGLSEESGSFADTGTTTNELNRANRPASTVTNIVTLKLGTSIPLSIQSAGVIWKGNTYNLVSLGSIKFELGTNDCLKAEIKAGVACFDDVDYDVSCAVFDATGQLLGTARAHCHERRAWAGNMEVKAETITLDFGTSLDYKRAAGFLVSISNREVLTPDQWPKPAPASQLPVREPSK